MEVSVRIHHRPASVPRGDGICVVESSQCSVCMLTLCRPECQSIPSDPLASPLFHFLQQYIRRHTATAVPGDISTTAPSRWYESRSWYYYLSQRSMLRVRQRFPSGIIRDYVCSRWRSEGCKNPQMMRVILAVKM
jgi:hypothetical protein